MQTIQPVQVYLLSLCVALFGCAGGKVREGPIHGSVLEVRGEGDAIRVDFSRGWFGGSTELQVVVEPGDLLWLKDGRDIRGDLVREGAGYKLQSIWPDLKSEEAQIQKKNTLLRRNTVDRGVAAFRETGEEIPEFALYDQDGTVVSNDYLKGRVSVLHFIFTRCSMPSMCPASTQKMGRLLEVVKSEGLEDVRLISITLDPRFDTPGVLKSYARGYGVDAPQSRFLTGPLQPVQDLKKQLGILSKPDEALIIKHTMRTILIGPDLKIVHHVPNSSWDVEDFLAKIRQMTNVDPS